MIRIDGIIYATIEDAKSVLLVAKRMEINGGALTSLDAPAATDLWVENNALLSEKTK